MGIALLKAVFLCKPDLIFLHQVANAAGLGASAVLIYPDPQDYDYLDETELYGHVSSNNECKVYPSPKYRKYTKLNSPLNQVLLLNVERWRQKIKKIFPDNCSCLIFEFSNIL